MTILDRDMTIDAVMRQWPPAVRVVLDFRMLCVGCPVGRFHTVADACRAHAVDEAAFLQALAGAAVRDRLW